MTLTLRTLEDSNIYKKLVLYRAPYDIGTEITNGGYILKDDSRIKATLPTLKHLLHNNCKIVILTYVGRPGGKYQRDLSTKPHAEALEKLLQHKVSHLDDCIGPKVESFTRAMNPQDIVMLENTRFHKEEMEDDDNFAKMLSRNGDYVVFDGFPQAHRKHASTTGILRHLPSCAGYYFEKEIEHLSGILDNPKRPLVILIGGVKTDTKIPVIKNFLGKADDILVGGALPLSPEAQLFKTNQKVHIAELTEDKLDINDASAQEFASIIASSETILWAGPMGKFEDKKHTKGTKIVIKAMETVKKSIAAGGDTIEAIKRIGDESKFSYISLAGGATLKFLAGEKLPVLEMLRTGHQA